MTDIYIGLLALKRSGKDTTAELVKQHFDGFKGRSGWESNVVVFNIKFAEVVKTTVKDLFDLDPGNKKDPLAREACIKIATAARDVDPDIWLNKAMKTVDTLKEFHNGMYKVFIFTDVRFPNEISALKRKNAFLSTIERKELYVWEKRLINLFGANKITRFVCKIFRSTLTHDSEWLYFTNRERANAEMINLSPENRAKYLTRYIEKEILNKSNAIIETQ